MNNFLTNPIPYMGARPYNRQQLQKLVDRDDPSLIFEYKYDGVYMTAHMNKYGNVRAYLRSGREVDLELLDMEVLQGLGRDLDHTVAGGHLTGELMLHTPEGWVRREVTSGYLNSLMQGGPKKEGYEFYYFCWGLWESSEDTLEQARHNLHSVSLPKYIKRVYSVIGADFLLEDFMARERIKLNNQNTNNPRLDGFIFKLGSQKFKEGKPSTCIKLKPPKTAYMYVIGWKPHTKKPDLIGSLYLANTEAGRLADVKVSVGSGLTDEDRGTLPNCFINTIVKIEYEDVTEPNKHGVRSLTLPRIVQCWSEGHEVTTLEEFIDG